MGFLIFREIYSAFFKRTRYNKDDWDCKKSVAENKRR